MLDSSTKLCTGFDGHLYAERSEKVARFDRDGKRLYRVKLPFEGVESIAADGAGQLFVRGWRAGDPMPREFVRVSADGRDVRVIATDRLGGGTVGRENTLVAAPDGTLYLFGWHQAIRTFGPDGTLRAMTARSREWEAEEDRNIAARA